MTAEQAPTDATFVLVHLSGTRRGTTERLQGDELRIGSGAAAEIQALGSEDAGSQSIHATLRRRGGSYEVAAAADRGVWVNGEHVDRLVLASGDVIELAREGPVLRFRRYPAGHAAAKSVGEAFSDCLDCARYEPGGALQKAGVFLRAVPYEIGTQTSLRFRAAMVASLILLAVAVGAVAWRTDRVERSLVSEARRVQGLAGLLEAQRLDSAANIGNRDALDGLRATLSAAQERIATLERRDQRVAEAIATASRATVFLLGSYGFVDAVSGLPMRVAVGPKGVPLRDADGDPLVTTEGAGPVVDLGYSGSGFIVGDHGLILTNRHVAQPWRSGESAAVISQGWMPRMHRFVGYLPGSKASFPVVFVDASDSADLAVVRGGGGAQTTAPLVLRATLPLPGDEVVVLGYPLGVQALLARADAATVAALRRSPATDEWSAAARLASVGQVTPLATRGIVGNSSVRAIIYDAETTHGGSGGPVLMISGEVVAINAAIMEGFGGSNFGVPARIALPFVKRHTR